MSRFSVKKLAAAQIEDAYQDALAKRDYRGKQDKDQAKKAAVKAFEGFCYYYVREEQELLISSLLYGQEWEYSVNWNKSPNFKKLWNSSSRKVKYVGLDELLLAAIFDIVQKEVKLVKDQDIIRYLDFI
jgi:hypothetical protein